MTLTIQERNEKAVLEMKARLQKRLDNEFHNFNKRQFVDFLKATNMLKKVSDETEFSDIQLTLFLLSEVDYSNYGEDPKFAHRFTLVANYEWAFNNAVRDITNRLEMGK